MTDKTAHAARDRAGRLVDDRDPARAEQLVVTPAGTLTLVAVAGRLVEVRWPHVGTRAEGNGTRAADDGTRAADDGTAASHLTDDREVLGRAAAQLAEYFAGGLREFDLPLRATGTAFEHAVWRAVAEIPYGETRSYGELARRLGRPTAARAVGRAVGRNPLPLVVPCHRVVGWDGRLTGYAGGPAVKQALLALEAGKIGRPTSVR